MPATKPISLASGIEPSSSANGPIGTGGAWPIDPLTSARRASPSPVPKPLTKLAVACVSLGSVSSNAIGAGVGTAARLVASARLRARPANFALARQ